ncbi:44343_t:CDS:2 [Gigaspora margarita]|uniref:44343_t:CDS:1 n=1 Tax=Gigaspora margarita TaxID=4874 RepID=A0ABN7X4V9_GIGMA|nr:44343_t:CDS:2 [Gigaspora margarita]
MRQEITYKVNKKISISLVDIDQLTIFEPINEEADITDPTIVSNIVTSIRKSGHQQITNILNYIIPLYVQKEVLKPGSTLHLRISENGQNVSKKAKHVMLTVALSNNWDKLHKPKSHYILVLFPDFYEIGGQYWNCYCNKENLTNTIEYSKISKDIEKIKESYAIFNGHIRPPLFNMILIKYWVCNSLHVILRISDRLWELFLSDLHHSELNENTQELILTEIKRLEVSFHFWIDQQTQSLKYISLLGPDKLNILKNFDFTKFVLKDFSQEHAIQLRQLWSGFLDLYNMMILPNITGSQFRIKAEL